MKKVILLFVLLCTAFFSKADQLQALTQAQAEKAVGYLKKEAVVILWCSCCDNETPKKVTVNEVFFKKDNDGKYYSVILKGRDENGKDVEEYLDLAYVFVKKGNKAKSLGKVLKFECDPCTKPFDWSV
ncbi:MAG: hypothetical protein K0R59_971 [Sphingobacterium sp.]|jgi:hypothetical protein|uniref:hypothetical protein n=1 Tax=unclassified Sphingobacterium TaxID=2609468 RepID=UPI000987864A|nr:hypothetical protein [Sphingobacterium sp. CZ-UAM]MDF2515675.1 hypothetical protein [Sphingobacterium sp.]OOG17870.1 hypothetical protein BWD42_11230 [Sphingobacterium sp. CZ-UAM]